MRRLNRPYEVRIQQPHFGKIQLFIGNHRPLAEDRLYVSVVCRQNGNMSNTRDIMDKAMKRMIILNPQYSNAYYNRGNVYAGIGKSEEAERDLAKAKELGYDP